MNTYWNETHFHSPDEQVWKNVDEVIDAIDHDFTSEHHDSNSDSDNARTNAFVTTDLVSDPHSDSRSERDISFFFSVVRRRIGIPLSEKSSLAERWSLERSQKNWLAKLQERLHAIHSANRESWSEIQDFFQSLQSTIEILSQRMIPAPVHRNATAPKEQIYQPRRRALEPADLPAFPSLFCTAIDPEAQPYVISGLAPGIPHHFSMICVQDNSVQYKQIITASEDGNLEIDIAGILIALRNQREGFSELVWFLSDESKENAWTSGLVWLESRATRKLATDTVRALMDNKVKNRPDSCIDALFEINLLSTREYYMAAYEQARQGLLFLPRQYREENSVPFKESLWLFINHLVDRMLTRLEKAEPVFHQTKPNWNAVNSLRVLKNRLKEWE